jgi:hypothetical protein
MTGLVPVIHVGVAPEGLGWAGNWKRVDGRDTPGTSPAMTVRGDREACSAAEAD